MTEPEVQQAAANQGAAVSQRPALIQRPGLSQRQSVVQRPALWALALALGVGSAVIPSASRGAEVPAEAVDMVLSALLGALLPLVAGMAFFGLQRYPYDAAIRYGADRRRIVGRQMVAATLIVTLVMTALTAAGLIVTRTQADPLLLPDLGASLPIAVMGSLALSALMAAARLWTGRVGLSLLVLLSWTIGQLDFVVSALLPTGHILHLIGVGEALPFAPWISMLSLTVFAVLFGVAALGRVPR